MNSSSRPTPSTGAFSEPHLRDYIMLRYMENPNFDVKPRHLIVLTEHSLLYSSWAFTLASSLKFQGFNVDILDVSSFRHDYISAKLFRLYYSLRYGQGVFFYQKFLQRKFSLSLQRPKFSNFFVSDRTLSSIEELEFLRAVDSENAERVGYRITAVEMLDSRTRKHSKIVYLKTYKFIEDFVKKSSLEAVYITGDRFLLSCATKSCLKSRGIDYKILEQVSPFTLNFEVFNKEFRKVELVRYIDEIAAKWQEMKEFSQTEKIVGEAIKKKLRGYRPGLIDFSSLQGRNKIPIEFVSILKSSIVFYPTSDIELSPIPSSEYIYRTAQTDALEVLLKVAKDLGKGVIIRAHPHPENPTRQLKENEIWKSYCDNQSVRLIESQSVFSTTEIIENAWLNCVYHSTVSVDSLILEKPVMVMGQNEISLSIPEIAAFEQEDIRNFIQNHDGRNTVKRDRIAPWLYFYSKIGNAPLGVTLTPANLIKVHGKKFELKRF